MLEFILCWALLYGFIYWLIHGDWLDLLYPALGIGLIVALL